MAHRFAGDRARPLIAVMIVAASLMGLTFSVAGSRPEASAETQGPVAAIELTKTVSDTGACDGTDVVIVSAGETVVYCYEVENTGDVTFTLHTLTDDQLGILLAGFFQTLDPGSTFAVSETAQIFATTVNTATWMAVGPEGSAFDSDTATVVVGEPAIELTKTVGTDPKVACATESSIFVPSGSEVIYCYEVENTGNVAFSLHDLVDDQLGILLDGLNQQLQPGQTLRLTTTTEIVATTVNSATWAARDPLFAQASAMATVTTDLVFADGFESGDVSAWQ